MAAISQMLLTSCLDERQPPAGFSLFSTLMSVVIYNAKDMFRRTACTLRSVSYIEVPLFYCKSKGESQMVPFQNQAFPTLRPTKVILTLKLAIVGAKISCNSLCWLHQRHSPMSCLFHGVSWRQNEGKSGGKLIVAGHITTLKWNLSVLLSARI